MGGRFLLAEGLKLLGVFDNPVVVFGMQLPELCLQLLLLRPEPRQPRLGFDELLGGFDVDLFHVFIQRRHDLIRFHQRLGLFLGRFERGFEGRNLPRQGFDFLLGERRFLLGGIRRGNQRVTVSGAGLEVADRVLELVDLVL